MEYEIKRINAWSVIKFVFLISFFIGTLIGIFYALILSIVCNLIQNITINELGLGVKSLNEISLFFLIIFFAIFISISNSIMSAIFIGTYNFIAQWLGGIKIALKLNNNMENL